MKKLQIIVIGCAILIMALGAIEINKSSLDVVCSEYTCNPSLYGNPCTVMCSSNGELMHLFSTGTSAGNYECCYGSWTKHYCFPDEP